MEPETLGALVYLAPVAQVDNADRFRIQAKPLEEFLGVRDGQEDGDIILESLRLFHGFMGPLDPSGDDALCTERDLFDEGSVRGYAAVPVFRVPLRDVFEE